LPWKTVVLTGFCPYQWGKLIGDDIQYGYHGITYNFNGECTRIPGQKKIQKTLIVPTYSVHEQHNIVWIWMGKNSMADTSKIFDMPQLS
tara:strand:+ start:40 stop:306 length:267 start_codon:yes stop_codon:yes gene_type:complete